MYKRILIFCIFLLLIPLLYLKARSLGLAYYVFSSMLILPLYYLYMPMDRLLFFIALGIFAAVEGYFFFLYFTPEMFFLILGHAALLSLLVLYQHHWIAYLAEEKQKNEGILREWEILRHKHQHRLENLQHLEKQAASLMDLFEIARDFSECLSYETLADLLHKKVRPELPFESLRLILERPPGEHVQDYRCFTIEETGVSESQMCPNENEQALMAVAGKERKLQVQDGLWFFPMFTEDECLAYMAVQGAEQGDLAKFEVLVAHLVLQIKKIRLYETVKGLSIIDGLTQVFVRRHFMELFESELQRSIKHGFSLALLMLDIDHFKRYNDDFGHLVGDATLREVASILRSSLRKVDIVGRHGGEEFIIVIPETGNVGASEVAERIRSSIARHSFKVYDVTTKVTASLGVAVFPADLNTAETNTYHPELLQELIAKADVALYRAKEEGRNRVIRYQDLKST